MIIRPKLSTDYPLFGLCITYPSPGIVERIGPDWDWVWIDGQHGQLAYQDVLNVVRACELVGKPVFIRVASHEYGEIGRSLDLAVEGLIVPCVDTVEQARQIVFAGKFPPLGGRSYGGRRVVDLTGRTYVAKANELTKLIAQIETPEAMENIEAIASLPGIDGLFLGPDDLLLRRGIAADAPRTLDLLREDLEKMADVCRRHGKIAITVGATLELAVYACRCGFQMIAGGGDVGLLANGSRKAVADLRAAVGAK